MRKGTLALCGLLSFKLASTWQNQRNGMCVQQRLRSASAFAQSDQSLCCALNGQLRAQCFFMRTRKTLIKLGGCPDWSESSLGKQVILLVLSWGVWNMHAQLSSGVRSTTLCLDLPLVHRLSEQRRLARLCGCAGSSELLLLAYGLAHLH